MKDVPLLGAPADLTADTRERWARALELGTAAAAGDGAAREELTGPQGGAVTDERGVLLYVDQTVFAEVVGTLPPYLRRLRADGRLIEPDVKVGRVWGWGIGRVAMWGIEYGYLAPDLSQVPTRKGRTEMVASGALDLDSRPHWRREVVAYLTQAEAGKVLGITGDSIYQARTRDTGPTEAIRIGALCGWSLEKLRVYNARRPPHRRREGTL